jgi:hypothetical protein
MRHAFIFGCALLWIGVSISVAQTTRASSPKKLIEFGWDEPDTAYMRSHIAEMEKMPFDGTVFHISYRKPDGSRGSFMNECWSSHAIVRDSVSGAMDDLARTKFASFTQNFLRFNVLPGDVGWFDDFSPVLHNAELAAEVAKKGHAAGILFDIEQYGTHLWDFREMSKKDPRDFQEYAAQLHQRGRELMQAFQRGYPNLKVFLTFGYSLPFSELNNSPERSRLGTSEYGLLVPFLDGMFEVAAGKSRIIDGFEISYGYKTPAQFKDAVTTVKKKVLPLVAEPKKYLAHISMGFGLWMDHDWRSNGWQTVDLSKNDFTPDQFQQSVSEALRACDEYVWIYTEKPRWWAGRDARPQDLPTQYIQALRNARARSR